MTLSLHLRATNARLGPLLDDLIPRSGEALLATPERMSALLSELLHTGAALRAAPLPARGTDHELDRELDRYRAQVERLRQIMPELQRSLLAERFRLERQRHRIHSVAAWASTSRQTFE